MPPQLQQRGPGLVRVSVPGERRPESRAAKGGAGDDAKHQRGEVERRPQEQQRTRNDTCVVAE
jgi:hypothetical protein